MRKNYSKDQKVEIIKKYLSGHSISMISSSRLQAEPPNRKTEDRQAEGLPLTTLVYRKLFRDLSVFNDVVHNVCGSGIEIVGISESKREGKTGLRIHIDQQNFFVMSCKTDSEVDGRCRFTDAALLIREGNYFAFIHVFLREKYFFAWLIPMKTNLHNISASFRC